MRWWLEAMCAAIEHVMCGLVELGVEGHNSWWMAGAVSMRIPEANYVRRS